MAFSLICVSKPYPELRLIQSSKPLMKAISMPSWILSYKFGKNNRENRSYQDVINRYHEKLSQNTNIISPFSKNMKEVQIIEIQELLNTFSQLNDKIIKKTKKLKKHKLDINLLPHPLMGRMTLREILMWNAYHTEHHYVILKEKY